MVKLIGHLLIAVTLPVFASQSYRVDPSTIALGEPVTLTLTSKPGFVDKLDLAPLAENFEIHSRNQGSDGKEESLVLTLYPLHAGRFSLPNFGFRGRPPTLTVSEQSENVPKVRFHFEIEPRQYHMRQFVRLTLEACDDGSLMWQRPQLPTRVGLFVRELNEEQVYVERDGAYCTAHRWNWSVMIASAGVTPLNLPMMEANKFGQRLRFPPPEIKFDSLEIPSWLPVDVAIGKPEISAQPVPEEWPIDRPLSWRMDVVGCYSPESLKNLLRVQLMNHPQFGRYEPVVKESGYDNGVPRHSVVLYPVFPESGDVKLPELVFPWYDAESGKLQQAILPVSNVLIFNPTTQRLKTWLMWLGIVLAVSSVAYILWGQLGWRLRRRRALAGLEQVSSVDELSYKLCSFGLGTRNIPAATLGEWLKFMQQETQTQGVAELVGLVESARYGLAEYEMRDLLQQARTCLSNAKPV